MSHFTTFFVGNSLLIIAYAKGIIDLYQAAFLFAGIAVGLIIDEVSRK